MRVKQWLGVFLVALLSASACGGSSSSAGAPSAGASLSEAAPLTTTPAAPSTSGAAPAIQKSQVEQCLKAHGIPVTHHPSSVVKTRYGALDAEFSKGEVIFLFTGSPAEAKTAAQGEIALAKGYGVDASNLVSIKDNVVYFFDGTFRHDQQTIDACLN